MIWAIAAGAALVGGGVGYLIYRRRRNNAEEEDEEVPLQAPTEYPSINLDSVTNESQVRKQLESLAKKSRTSS